MASESLSVSPVSNAFCIAAIVRRTRASSETNNRPKTNQPKTPIRPKNKIRPAIFISQSPMRDDAPLNVAAGNHPVQMVFDDGRAVVAHEIIRVMRHAGRFQAPRRVGLRVALV